MEQLKAFLIKLIGISILTFSIFGIFFNATVGNLLLMTIVVTVVTFLGDLFVLPRINQVAAVFADLATLFLLYWFLGSYFVEPTMSLIIPAATAAYLGTAGEAIFHIYMMDRVHEPDRSAPVPTRFQTEFAKESNLETIKKNERNHPEE